MRYSSLPQQLLQNVQILTFLVASWWTWSQHPTAQYGPVSMLILLLTAAIFLGGIRALKQYQKIELLHMELLSLKWQIENQRSATENTLEQALQQEGYPASLTKEIVLHLSAHETHMIRVLQERKSRGLWECYTHPVIALWYAILALGVVGLPLFLMHLYLPKKWFFCYATPSLAMCILTIATILSLGRNHPASISSVVIINSIVVFANITLHHLLKMAYG